jgi:hypothetical protein
MTSPPDVSVMSSNDSSTSKLRTEDSKRSHRDGWEPSFDDLDLLVAE